MGNRHRPGDPRAALDRVEDVLRRIEPRSARHPIRRRMRWTSALRACCRSPIAARSERAIRFGLAVGGEKLINRRSVFARKKLFLPGSAQGLPGSASSSFPSSKAEKIRILTKSGEKTVRLTRAHLEEDAGKSLHENFQDVSGIDLKPGGRAAARNRFGARHALGGGSGCVRQGAAFPHSRRN